MIKDEARSAIMGAISMALKAPILQQGFEIICKENAELKADNDARKFAMAMSEKVEKQLREENAELKKEWQEQVQKATDEGYARTLQTIQLTKAKNVIKKFYDFVNNDIEYDPENPEVHTKLWNELCAEADQFLKDSDIDNAIQQANEGLDFDKIADEMEQDLKDSEVKKK